MRIPDKLIMYKKLYLIEIVRYGDPELSVQTFTITDDFDKIEYEMILYNQFRGGKYPAYYVTELNMNEFNLQPRKRVRFDIQNEDGKWIAKPTGSDQKP